MFKLQSIVMERSISIMPKKMSTLCWLELAGWWEACPAPWADRAPGSDPLPENKHHKHPKHLVPSLLRHPLQLLPHRDHFLFTRHPTWPQPCLQGINTFLLRLQQAPLVFDKQMQWDSLRRYQSLLDITQHIFLKIKLWWLERECANQRIAVQVQAGWAGW